MRQVKLVGLAALLVAATASAAMAQRNVRTSNAQASSDKFWEFGADFVSLNFELDPGDATTIGLGAGVLRVGRSITPAMTIEPSLLFGRTSSGGASSSSLNIEAGLLYHFQADRTARQFYVRPLITFQHQSASGGGSDSNVGFGVGGGIKIPSKKNSRFTYRSELTYRTVSSNGTTFSDLTLSGGVSVYNR